jgi:D-serine deaminase-like pyridoxal phosphate-dependent protein
MRNAGYSVGCDKNELDTPALWVDLAIMERNIAKMVQFIQSAGVDWRPHTKGIKIPEIAHKLIASGAIGITCAKLGEAEVMAAAGIHDILIASQVVGRIKTTRLANLRRYADVIVAIDSLDNARQLSDAACLAGVSIRVLVEVNIGMDRCGVQPGKSALHLAEQITELSGLRFSGVMGWEGHTVGIKDPEEKERCVHLAVESLVATARMIRSNGLETPIVSCGGSGSYRISALIPGVTEVQAGGAVLGDVTYAEWGAQTESGLFILATVISRPVPERAVVDAGRKAMNGEVSMPAARDFPGVSLSKLNAEHGILAIDDPSPILKVGDKLDFIAGYGDNTVFLHDCLFGVRNGKVEVVWQVQGRGRLD